jgi:hypothetical protein
MIAAKSATASGTAVRFADHLHRERWLHRKCVEWKDRQHCRQAFWLMWRPEVR